MQVIASRYAESLFDLALDENKIDTYNTDVECIYNIFNENPSFVDFFSHILVNEQDKFDLVDKAFSNQVDSYVLNFIKLLVKKKRIRYINDICLAFKDLSNDHFGIEEGVIFSPYPLLDEQVAELESTLSAKENKKIILRVVEDKSLIGGIKVQLKNRIIDSTVKNKLETLKKELIRK